MIVKKVITETVTLAKKKAKNNLFLQMAEDKQAILSELSGDVPKGKSALVDIVNPF